MLIHPAACLITVKYKCMLKRVILATPLTGFRRKKELLNQVFASFKAIFDASHKKEFHIEINRKQ